VTELKDVTVYFRVSDVYRNVKIEVLNGEEVLISKKKQKVAPGEKESILLKREMLENSEELMIRLKEAE
jgi:hypothetical protein